MVHGVHARLSNISSSGHWIEDEQFWWRGQLTKRKASESAGRMIWAYRELRNAKPLLVQKLSIMQQPAGNVDSIPFHRSQLELSKLSPCAVHQRDCFKMTAQLQLTDTGYSRSFKSLCQERVTTLRRAGQQALLKDGCRAVCQASVEDCDVAVVSAQSEMSLRQTQTDWIVAGLRRNGILSYKPDFKSGEMKPLKDEPAADYAQGF